MQKINFKIKITAPKERVWKILWNDETYKVWTSAFSEGSYARTDNWKEGSKVLFLDPKGNGMVSIIVANRPNEFMSFRHIGFVQNGVEDISSDQVKAWAGALEDYSLHEEDGVTTLFIEMDTAEDYKDYFLKTWPLAIEKIKELAEN